MPVLHCKPCDVKRIVEGLSDPSKCRYCGSSMDYFDNAETLELLIRKSSVQSVGHGDACNPASQTADQRRHGNDDQIPTSLVRMTARHIYVSGTDDTNNSIAVPCAGPLSHPSTPDAGDNTPRRTWPGRSSKSGHEIAPTQPISNRTVVIKTPGRHGDHEAKPVTTPPLSQVRVRESTNLINDRYRERSPRGRERDYRDREQSATAGLGSRPVQRPIPIGQRQASRNETNTLNHPLPARPDARGHGSTIVAHRPALLQLEPTRSGEAEKADVWCLLHHIDEHGEGAGACNPRKMAVPQVTKEIPITWISDRDTRFGETDWTISDAVSFFNQMYLANRMLRGYEAFRLNRDCIFQRILALLPARVSNTVVKKFVLYMSRANTICHAYVKTSSCFLLDTIGKLLTKVQNHPKLPKLDAYYKTAKDRSPLAGGLFWLDWHGTPLKHSAKGVKSLRKRLLKTASAYREAKMSLTSEICLYIEKDMELASSIHLPWLEDVFSSTFQAQPWALMAASPSDLQGTEWPSLQSVATACTGDRPLPETTADRAKYCDADPNLPNRRSRDKDRGTQAEASSSAKAGSSRRKANVVKSEVKMENGD